MNEKITLDMLTQDSVSVKRQQYTVVDGIEYPIGDPHRKAYVNSEEGRTAIVAELPPTYHGAILAVWGDMPSIIE